MKVLTLENFYQSKEWKEFREVLIQQREDKETGLTFCEYCGKPIFGTGQIICHHLEELTDLNVNNPQISLNPDNIALVHLNCHNVIHSKFINCKKEVYLLYGPPTSYFEFLENEVGNNDIVVCLDWIYKALNPQNILFPKTKGLTNPAFKIRDLLLDVVKARRGNWSKAYVCGGYQYMRDRETICDQLGIPDNNIIFFNMTKEATIANARKYNAPRTYDKYIHEWFEEYEE